MAAKERCAYGDIELFGIVEPVLGGCLTVDRSHKARRCHKCSGQCS